MADGEKKKGGLMGLIVPLLVVGLAGIGTGFGVSSFLGKPKVTPEAPPSDPAAAAAAGQSADKKDKDKSAEAKPDEKKDGKVDTEAVHSAGLLIDQQKAMVVSMKDTEFVPLTPVIANLANPSTSWIRLEGAVAVKKGDGKEGKPADVVNLVAPKILDYLKTLSLDQVQGADNLAFLNMDLNEIVRAASNGQAQAILVTGFVVE